MKKKALALFLGMLGLAVIGGCIYALFEGRESEVRKNYHTEKLGENVYIFSPEDDPNEVNQILADIYEKQEKNQFGKERYGIYFLPGEYSDEIEVNIGFYMQVAGLGISPEDTRLHEVNSLARWLGDDSNHNACCNFWRSLENLTVEENVVWAVSQATDMRRMNMEGALYLHDNNGWCSGGFTADTNVALLVDSGSQQQWLSRNCDWNEWMGQNWNMVFVGEASGDAPRGTWPVKPYTTVEATEAVREKPFLIYDEKLGYGVYMSALREDAIGTSWRDKTLNPSWVRDESGLKEALEQNEDYVLSLDTFYIADPKKDNAFSINEALKKGKNLLLTPGIYELEDSIKVTGENTVVLGLGLASLTPTQGNACMEVSDLSNITLAGILFDAGMEESENLLLVGQGTEEKADKAYPICLSDLYFRVGGGDTRKSCKSKNCLLINANDCIGDNFWIWRADHGDMVAWDKNEADNGLIVKGDRVICYALMVEHFKEYQTIWEGNEGRVYMYQSEIPYDVPAQEEWMSHEGNRKGYASFFVADSVTDFKAFGLGIYLYNRDASVVLESAMEMPDCDGVSVEHICTVMLTGNPGMNHIINEAGKAVTHPSERQILLNYENGRYEE